MSMYTNTYLFFENSSSCLLDIYFHFEKYFVFLAKDRILNLQNLQLIKIKIKNIFKNGKKNNKIK